MKINNNSLEVTDFLAFCKEYRYSIGALFRSMTNEKIEQMENIFTAFAYSQGFTTYILHNSVKVVHNDKRYLVELPVFNGESFVIMLKDMYFDFLDNPTAYLIPLKELAE